MNCVGGVSTARPGSRLAMRTRPSGVRRSTGVVQTRLPASTGYKSPFSDFPGAYSPARSEYSSKLGTSRSSSPLPGSHSPKMNRYAPFRFSYGPLCKNTAYRPPAMVCTPTSPSGCTRWLTVMQASYRSFSWAVICGSSWLMAIYSRPTRPREEANRHTASQAAAAESLYAPARRAPTHRSPPLSTIAPTSSSTEPIRSRQTRSAL